MDERAIRNRRAIPTQHITVDQELEGSGGTSLR